MNNLKRGQILVVSSMFNSGVVFTQLLMSVFSNNGTQLKIAVIFCGLMISNLLLATMYMDAEDEPIPLITNVIALLTLVPLATVVIIITFVIELIQIIFIKKRGGVDYYDD